MNAVFNHFGVCDDVADKISLDIHSSKLKKVHKELMGFGCVCRWVGGYGCGCGCGGGVVWCGRVGMWVCENKNMSSCGCSLCRRRRSWD